MEDIFNFNNTYAGAIIHGDLTIPCNLAFPDQNIVFTIISPERETGLKDYLKLSSFSGYISTEKGIKNFCASDSFLIANSSTWSQYSRQSFMANDLVVSHEKNNIRQERFAYANILFDKLELIGRYLDIDHELDSIKNISVTPLFESITFLKAKNEELELINYFRWNNRSSSKQIFTITIDPYLSFKPVNPLTLEEIQIETNRIAWFLELLLETRQNPTGVILYDILPPNSQPASEYYYFHKKIITARVKRGTVSSPHPSFNIEKLTKDIALSYPIWHSFDDKQNKICRLYFNELHSKEYIQDDRFKNFCSIIQGLSVFTGNHKVPGVRNEMTGKLRAAITTELEEIVFKKFDQEFIYELCVLIGHQRDHYQHLNKPLKYDLGQNSDDIIAVNQFLSAIIKYHLLKAVQFPDDKIRTLILRELGWCELDLKRLSKKLKK